MEDISKAIEGFCSVSTAPNAANEYSNYLNTILIEINRGDRVSYTSLVKEHLGPYLTNHDSNTRMRTTLLLAELLHRLPDLPMNSKMASSLLIFFADRVESDYDSAVPCFFAIKTILINRRTILKGQKEVIKKVSTSLLEAHYVPSMAQSFRYGVFEVTKVLVDKYFDFVKAQGLDYIQKFANAMDGEKDPRCLILCLAICEKLLLKSDKEIIEEATPLLFEMTSVYFPITFRPPPNDPYGITTENLVEHLVAVFKSTEFMSKHVLPMTLEKLKLKKQEVSIAKIDSLRLLSSCIPYYNVSHITPFLDPLQSALYENVVNADDAAIADEAVITIRILAKEIAKDYDLDWKEMNEGPWNSFCGSLINRCVEQINSSIDSMLSRGSSRIVEAIASSSGLGLRYCLNVFVPIAKKWLEDPDHVATQRGATLNLLHCLLRGISRDIDYKHDVNPFLGHVEPIFNLLYQELEKLDEDVISKTTEDTSAKLAIQGLEMMICRPPSNILNYAQICKAIHRLSQLLVYQNIREECMHALKNSGKTNSVARVSIVNDTIPSLFSLIESNTHKNLFWVLDVFVELCSLAGVFIRIVPDLLNLVISEKDHIFIESAYLGKVLETLNALVEQNKSSEEAMASCLTRDQATPGLVSQILSATLNTEMLLEENLNVQTYCSSIVRTVIQSGSKNEQDKVAAIGVEILLRPSLEFELLRRILPTLTAILGSLRETEECVECMKQSHEWLEHICKIAVYMLENNYEELGDFACTSISKLLGSLINKAEDVGQLKQDILMNKFFVKPFGKAEGLLLKTRNPRHLKKLRIANLKCLVWVFKALAMRHDPAAEDIGEEFVNLLHDDDSAVRDIAAESFGNVIRYDEDVLNRSCYARESILFRQRFFEENFESLKRELPSSTGAFREALLLAIAKLIEHAPISLTMNAIEDGFPLLVQALDSKRIRVQASALTSIQEILGHDINHISPHLSKIIPLVLELTIYKAGSTARDRMNAIGCLSAIARKLSYPKVHPFKHLVTRRLKYALDDRKRLVRSAAVECRNLWMTLQADV